MPCQPLIARSASRLRVLLLATVAIFGGTLAAPVFAQPALEADPGIEQQFGGKQTLAVVALSGYEPLMSDVDFIGAMIDQPQSSQAINGMIALFTQGRGLQGLDQTRPWGVLVESNGPEFAITICLPIDDLGAILELAQAFGVASADAGGGVTELTIPNTPQPLFAKQVGEWVFVSQAAETLDDAPEDPSELLAELVEDYDLGAKVLAQNVPQLYRQFAIDALRQGAADGLEQFDDETDEEFASRQQLTQVQIEQFVSLIEELNTLELGIAINEKIADGLVIDFEITANPGSELDKQLKATKDSTTNFAGFKDESAAMMATFSVKTPADVLASQKEQMEAALAVLRKQMLYAIDEEVDLPDEADRESFKQAATELFDAYEATALAGEIDGAIQLDLAPGEFTLVAGTQFQETDKVESALKRLGELGADEPDFPEIAWDAKQHAGVNFHTISIPVPGNEPEAQLIFGQTLEVAVGIAPERIYLSAGAGAYEKLIAAIDASATAGSTSIKPVEITFSLKKFADFVVSVADGPDAAGAQLFADMIAKAGSDDHVRFIFESTDKGMRYRIHAEEGVVEAIARVAQEGARQAGAGLGGPGF